MRFVAGILLTLVISRAHAAGTATHVYPSASDQFTAVLNAPLPFFLALFAVVAALAVAIWRAFEWRYGGIIEMTRTMVEAAKTDAASSKTRESELKETVKSLESEIEALTHKMATTTGADGAKEDRAKVEKILKLAHTASDQLSVLSTANSAVSDSLYRIPTIIGTIKATEKSDQG
jgi:septal ring factor EnvC (AmiA/AmiB activator)